MSTNFKHIKKPGYKTPEGYFDNLEDAVFKKLNAKSNLDTIKNPGFNVPKDYFSTVEANVFNTLKNENKDVKIVSLFSRKNLLYMSGVAAAVVLMFSLFINKTESVTEDIDYDLIANYIIEQNISSYDLATLLTEEELTTIHSEISNEAFNDEDMEAYLLNNANLEDIIEQ
jgi:hypothetical protein